MIAIDGFSSCGKSTLARQLAVQLGYNYVDSGAMYRAITLYFIRHSIDITDPEIVRGALENISLSFRFNKERGASDIYLNGENVEPFIREMAVSQRVSEVAAIKAVRQFAVAQQQLMGKDKGIVMDGRDIGTDVFPHAELKLYMTADPEIRAKRRFEELQASSPSITMDEVRSNLEKRDHIDTTREESPLRQAPDAIVLDNSNMSREEQLEFAARMVRERTPNSPRTSAGS